MSTFLSPEWIADLDAAATGATVPDGVRLTIQQVVTGEAEAVCYHMVIEDGRLRVHAGEAPAADITFVQTRAVATALSRGELNAQRALEAGELKLRGDLQRVAREGRALVALEDVLAAVRAETTY